MSMAQYDDIKTIDVPLGRPGPTRMNAMLQAGYELIQSEMVTGPDGVSVMRYWYGRYRLAGPHLPPPKPKLDLNDIVARGVKAMSDGQEALHDVHQQEGEKTTAVLKIFAQVAHELAVLANEMKGDTR